MRKTLFSNKIQENKVFEILFLHDSPSKHQWADREARERQRGAEKSSGSYLRGLGHPPTRHPLA